MPDLREPSVRRDLVERAFRAGLDRVEPRAAVRQVLRRDGRDLLVGDERITVRGRVLVVAIGKAATPMAAAAGDVLGELVSEGYLLTKDGHADAPPSGFAVFEAAHPVPDERGIDASRRILAAVEDLTEDDVALALISGGGSALFEAPAGDLTLDDIQQTTDLLLRAGAPIQHLNAVRSELSRVKGGGFRRAIGSARTVSLILSDVLGNPPDVIASGPTVPREPNRQQARELLDRYELRESVPSAVLRHLESDAEDEGSVDAARDRFEIVGDNDTFVAAVEASLADAGLRTERLWREQEGEARDRAAEWVEALARTDAEAIVGGGEMTVTVRGDGTGGRNTEFALAAAMRLGESALAATVASLASDGQDGGVDAAGAVVDESTMAELERAGVDAQAALDRNDSGTALGDIGALIAPGPTGTNVNDVYIGLRAQS